MKTSERQFDIEFLFFSPSLLSPRSSRRLTSCSSCFTRSRVVLHCEICGPGMETGTKQLFPFWLLSCCVTCTEYTARVLGAHYGIPFWWDEDVWKRSHVFWKIACLILKLYSDNSEQRWALSHQFWGVCNGAVLYLSTIINIVFLWLFYSNSPSTNLFLQRRLRFVVSAINSWSTFSVGGVRSAVQKMEAGYRLNPF